MNVLEIQKLINQIGDVDVKINEQKFESLLDGVNVKDINQSSLEYLKDEFKKKLINQINQKSDVELLQGFLDSVSFHVENLKLNYHTNRIKMINSKSENHQLSKLYKNLCQLIIIKIDVLETIQNELIPIINNYNYRLETDFIQNQNQSIEKPFENEELNLKYLPKLNLNERYKLLNLLKINVVFENLEMDKKAKAKLLALTMGISLDNARHLLAGTNKHTSESENKSLEKFLLKENIIL